MTPVEPLPFVLRTADAPQLGVGRKLLRSEAFCHVRRGAWVPGGVDREHPDTRIAAVVAQLPPHAVIGGWAAARLHERAVARDSLEVFDGSRRWEEPTAGHAAAATGGARVVVCAARESRLTWRADVRIYRSEVGESERTTVGDVTVTSVLRTAFDLARLLPFAPGVVAVDRLLHLDALDAGELEALVERRRRWQGRPAAVRVLAAADAGAESPQETLLRLLWIDGGFPRPVANHDVVAWDGRHLGRADLLDPEAGVVGEYDGAVHSPYDQRAADARRQEALEDVGLVVVRATAADLRGPARRAQWLQRLRAAYRRAAAQPAGRRGWRVVEPRR